MSRCLPVSVLLLVSAFALAALPRAEQLPQKLKAGDEVLQLNGAGLRTATLLNVKVYSAGLYLSKPSRDAQQILSSPEVKEVRMVFLRDLDREKLSDAWRESFEKNCADQCDAFKTHLSQLRAVMPAVKEGDVMAYVFYPGHTEIQLNAKRHAQIPSGSFGKILLSSWLGPDPISKDLKEGMLGLRAPASQANAGYYY